MSCLDNSIDLLLEILTLHWRSSINVRQEEEESTTLKEGKGWLVYIGRKAERSFFGWNLEQRGEFR